MPDGAQIRTHLEALQAQNPVALARAGEGLAALKFWAPALHALREARRIFLRRRAAGSVTNMDERIREVETAASEHVAWFVAEDLNGEGKERLTPRETTAAKLAASGLANREIAEQMQCSVRTVESHIAQARAKLGLASRDEFQKHFDAAATRP